MIFVLADRLGFYHFCGVLTFLLWIYAPHQFCKSLIRCIRSRHLFLKFFNHEQSRSTVAEDVCSTTSVPGKMDCILIVCEPRAKPVSMATENCSFLATECKQRYLDNHPSNNQQGPCQVQSFKGVRSTSGWSLRHAINANNTAVMKNDITVNGRTANS